MPDPVAAASPRRSLPRRVVLALTPLLVLLVLAEVGLRLAGIDGSDHGASLSRGFDPAAAYLLPDGDGGFVTRMFDGGRPETTVAPKGEAVRVLLFGGSNTQGFPADVLADELTRRAPETAWEVINLGRSGYGSARVAILFEQALALQPDLVLIYSGHNEFVERGFVEELQRQGASGWARRAAELANHLRVFRVLSDALARPGLPGAGDGYVQGDAAGAGGVDGGGDGGGDSAGAGGVDGGDGGGDGDGAPLPEPFENLPGAFAELTYDETLRYLDAYRANLERMLELAAERGLPAVLCTLVSNDLSAPWGNRPNPALEPAAAERLAAIQRELNGLLPRRLVMGLRPALRLTGRSWGRTLRPEERAARLAVPARSRPPRLRPLSGPLADAPATSGPLTESVAGAHWTDPDLWADEVFDLLEVLARFHARALFPGELDKLDTAEALLAEALALDPTHPASHFARGLVALLRDDGAQATASLAEAGRWDRAPRHGNPAIDGVIRAVAGDHDGVTLCDAEALFAARCPDGLVGYEVMMDHCHLHPGARPVLMADLAPALIAAWRGR